MHALSLEHADSQAPQLSSSLSKSTQLFDELQKFRPASHTGVGSAKFSTSEVVVDVVGDAEAACIMLAS